MKSAMAMLAAVGVAAPAGCGSAPTCEEAVDHATRVFARDGDDVSLDRASNIARCKDEWSAERRTCIKAATDPAALVRCTATRSVGSVAGFDDYQQRSKETEARIRLRSIGKGLEAHYLEKETFPVGRVGLTPATSCCAQPDQKCAPDPALWRDPIWQAVDFAIDEPHRFRFAYESDGTRATVRATGDLTCNLAASVFVMTCTATDGRPACDVAAPVRAN